MKMLHIPVVKWLIKASFMLRTEILTHVLIKSPIQWVPRVISPVVKQSEENTEHSSSSNTQFKNEWSCNSIPFVC
jgi:hypothetical protein